MDRHINKIVILVSTAVLFLTILTACTAGLPEYDLFRIKNIKNISVIPTVFMSEGDRSGAAVATEQQIVTELVKSGWFTKVVPPQDILLKMRVDKVLSKAAYQISFYYFSKSKLSRFADKLAIVRQRLGDEIVAISRYQFVDESKINSIGTLERSMANMPKMQRVEFGFWIVDLSTGNIVYEGYSSVQREIGAMYAMITPEDARTLVKEAMSKLLKKAN